MSAAHPGRRRIHQFVSGGGEFLPVEGEASLGGAHLHFGAVTDLAFQYLMRQRILQPALDHPLQRTRAIDRIVAGMGQPFGGFLVQRDLDLAVGQKTREPPDLDMHDLVHVHPREAVKQDDLVQPVEEFGTEMSPHRRHHLGAGMLLVAVFVGREEFSAQIRSEDDHRVAEIHGAALAVGQAAIVQHLKQHIEHVAVRLFDFVEQDHLIGPAPHRFGEDTALFITNITGRSADQPRHRMLFHELAHVDAHHGGVVVEQERRQRLGEFGLAHAGRAQEQE